MSIATQPKAKPKICAKYDYQALWPVDAKYATRPSPLSVEHSQIVALFWNLRFCAPPPIKSGQGPKSPSVVKVAPPWWYQQWYLPTASMLSMSFY